MLRANNITVKDLAEFDVIANIDQYLTADYMIRLAVLCSQPQNITNILNALLDANFLDVHEIEDFIFVNTILQKLTQDFADIFEKKNQLAFVIALICSNPPKRQMIFSKQSDESLKQLMLFCTETYSSNQTIKENFDKFGEAYNSVIEEILNEQNRREEGLPLVIINSESSREMPKTSSTKQLAAAIMTPKSIHIAPEELNATIIGRVLSHNSVALTKAMIFPDGSNCNVQFVPPYDTTARPNHLVRKIASLIPDPTATFAQRGTDLISALLSREGYINLFRCPISRQVLTNPYVARNGRTYNLDSLRNINAYDIYPNIVLKTLLEHPLIKKILAKAQTSYSSYLFTPAARSFEKKPSLQNTNFLHKSK